MPSPWYNPLPLEPHTRALAERLNAELKKIEQAFAQLPDPSAIGIGAGSPNYTWIAWADSADGTANFSTVSPGNRTYIGMAANRTSPVKSNFPEDYVWTRLQGSAGSSAPPVVLQYSVTGAGGWHTPFVPGDKYWRQSVDGGVTFSPGERLSAATLAELDAAANAALAAAGADIVSLKSRMSSAEASVTSEAETRAFADAATAATLTTVQTTLDGQTTTVTQHTTSINGIQGKYGVTIDAGGKITGIELIGGGGASSFTVKADQFAIETAGSKPFEVIGGVTYIKNAVIQDGTIGTVKIAQFGVSKGYSAEAASNVTIPNASGRSRVVSVVVTKDEATSVMKVQFLMRPRPGHDWAGQFIVGVNSGSGDVDLDSVWQWAPSVVISGFRSVRIPIAYSRRFTGLTAGTHTFYVDVLSYNTPAASGFVEAGSGIEIEEKKR